MRFDGSALLDINWPTAFKVISGNASGTTPKVSAWIKLSGVESIAILFVTGAATNVTWSARVAQGPVGQNAIALDSAYLSAAFPTGTAQNASRTITMPTGFDYLELTGTPSAGAAAVEASPGLLVGRPAKINGLSLIGLHVTAPAADNISGTAVIEVSGNWNPGEINGLGTLPKNTPSSPARWDVLRDTSQDAIVIPTPAGSGVNETIRVGHLEFPALRASITLASGFGSFATYLSGKAI